MLWTATTNEKRSTERWTAVRAARLPLLRKFDEALYALKIGDRFWRLQRHQDDTVKGMRCVKAFEDVVVGLSSVATNQTHPMTTVSCKSGTVFSWTGCYSTAYGTDGSSADQLVAWPFIDRQVLCAMMDDEILFMS